MGEYILIVLAGLLIAGQFTFNKLYEQRISSSVFAFLLFPLVAAVIDAGLFFCINGFSLEFSTFSFLLALTNAVLQVGSIVCSILVVRWGPVSIYTIFMMLGGMILPCFYGVCFLQETPSVWAIIGVFVLIAALITSAIPPKVGKPKNAGKFFFFCMLVFFLNGGTSIVSKAHQINTQALPVLDYMVWNYLLQFAISAICVLSLYLFNVAKKAPKRGSIRSKQGLWKILLIAALYAVCTGVGYLMILLGASAVAASVLYPLITGISIITTTVVTRIVFKEKINRNNLIGLILLVVGMVLFVF
ncbi:MAG: hypothetical protein ACI4SH_01610 [Candidatus Scatosoma sp.]